ncbi:MAG: YdcF family protein [Cyanobacteriota bacterium]|nr:YdcF family protein [Cyanobacteriota bacterium]
MMFVLSKLLPLLVLPLGLSLLLLGWGIGRGRWATVKAAFALLWLLATPLTAQGLWRLIERPWQPLRPQSLPTAAAIVVLGGGRHPAPGPLRRTEWVDADRFFGGLELFRAGKAPLLLFTGGAITLQRGVPTEGEVHRQQSLALGLPARALAVTPYVRNTAEEARAVAAQLPRGSRVLLVTSAFHMARAKALFARQGLEVVPYPVDFQARGSWAGSVTKDFRYWLPSAEGLEDSSRALREAMGRLAYRS